MKNKLSITHTLAKTILLVLLAVWLGGSVKTNASLEPIPALDGAWQQAEEKELTIDTSITLQQPLFTPNTPALPTAARNLWGVTDADIFQGYPNSNCGSDLLMHVGYDDYLSPDGQIVRGLAKFDSLMEVAYQNDGVTIYKARR